MQYHYFLKRNPPGQGTLDSTPQPRGVVPWYRGTGGGGRAYSASQVLLNLYPAPAPAPATPRSQETSRKIASDE